VKEVLRRREVGQGLRESARDTGLDRNSLRRYVQAAADGPADEEAVREAVQQVQERSLADTSEPRKRLEADGEL